MAARAPLIGLLSDFGTADWYVASVKGVILSICPSARLVDISHEVPPQDVVAGAWLLAAAAPWFAAHTIFVAVVDPGVGTSRALLAAQADGQWLVGPDNGVLSLVLQRARRRRIVRLTNTRYWLSPVSQTFHGRDILAPVAAHLARGCPLKTFGRPVSRYQTLRIPSPRPTRQGWRGHVAHLDRFGNLITTIPADRTGAVGWVRYRRRHIRVVSSYGEGKPGELIALAGSSGHLELAIREGSAARRYHARRGQVVELWRLS